MKTQSSPVLLLGNPLLRLVSAPVTNFGSAPFHANLDALRNTLHAFREKNGFGRAMAAPQIGILERIIVLHWEGVTSFLINPQITWRSDKMLSLWDDCMSLPGLMVKVARHESISIRFHDANGAMQEWSNLSFELSELLQHEMDHLDGVLAIDRALDRDSLVAREEFLANTDHYFKQVDYVIPSYRSVTMENPS